MSSNSIHIVYRNRDLLLCNWSDWLTYTEKGNCFCLLSGKELKAKRFFFSLFFSDDIAIKLKTESFLWAMRSLKLIIIITVNYQPDPSSSKGG